MNRARSRKPLLFVSLGLLGLGLWTIASAYGLPPALQSDFARGFFPGLCIGVEALGCVLLFKQKRETKLDC